jgi:hypothetical protein
LLSMTLEGTLRCNGLDVAFVKIVVSPRSALYAVLFNINGSNSPQLAAINFLRMMRVPSLGPPSRERALSTEEAQIFLRYA